MFIARKARQGCCSNNTTQKKFQFPSFFFFLFALPSFSVAKKTLLVFFPFSFSLFNFSSLLYPSLACLVSSDTPRL